MVWLSVVFYDVVRPDQLSAGQVESAVDGFDGYWCWIIGARQIASARQYFAMDDFHDGCGIGIYDAGCVE